MMNFRKYILLILLYCGVCLSGIGQHYFVIESESQQAFYLRLADTIYSSSGGGFMIVPRNMEKMLSCTIGFPKNKYPEIRFELENMDKDRGFYLRQFEGKGWGLFDRTTMEVLIGKSVANVESSAVPLQSKAKGNEFATMLSEVTGDKTLLERPVEPIKVKEEKLVNKSIPEKSKTPDTIEVPLAVIEIPTALSVIKKVTQDSSKTDGLRIVYIDSMTQGSVDTIDMQIEVKQVVAKDEPKLDRTRIVLYECKFSAARDTDLKTIQRKLLGFNDEEGQLAFLKKSYKDKCFTTKQTLEISWFLSDESVRLGFYELAMPFLSDRDHIMVLESGLMKEESIKAFKELISRNSSN